MFLWSLILATACFIFMIMINVLANTIPINGTQTGDVSNKYTNLFQPSGFTFSIWGILYTMMLFFLIFQYRHLNQPMSDSVLRSYMIIHLLFALSSVFNVAWLWVWHHERIGWSTGMMVLLLITLGFLVQETPKDDVLAYWTFSAYLGWISVATLANMTIFWVALGVSGLNKTAVILTHVILLMGVILTSVMVLNIGNVVFALPVVWAYLGIFKRHAYERPGNKTYPSIYRMSLVWIIFLLVILMIEIF